MNRITQIELWTVDNSCSDVLIGAPVFVSVRPLIPGDLENPWT